SCSSALYFLRNFPLSLHVNLTVGLSFKLLATLFLLCWFRSWLRLFCRCCRVCIGFGQRFFCRGFFGCRLFGRRFCSKLFRSYLFCTSLFRSDSALGLG